MSRPHPPAFTWDSKGLYLVLAGMPVPETISKSGRIIKSAIQWGCIGHCTFEYVGDLVLSSGPSMEPTIIENNVLYCDHILSRFTGVKSGDIVISRSVTDPNIYVCKRVGGVSGDLVWSGHKFVSVPRGHVWLIGDNPRNSNDSRSYGAVPSALIRGRVVCCIWPFNSIKWFSRI